MAESQLYAKVLSIDTIPAGASLEAEAAASATTLLVSKVTDFPADGGSLKIGDLVLEFTSADDTDTPTINLSAPLVDAVPEGALVLVEPYSETKIAKVTLGDGGDGLDVTVPHALSALLDDGQRDPDDAETVTLAESSTARWRMVDVLGRRPELTAESAENLPDPDLTDGVPPAESPTPEVLGGIGAIHVRWSAVVNADPVTYWVHVALVPDFTPDGTTLVTQTGATSTTVRTTPDGEPLVYDTLYYFKIIASDADGAADPGPAGGAQVVKITGPDIAADYVYAGNIVADQILGGTINTDLLIAGTMKTAEEGSRVEWGAFGLVVYDSAGVPTTLLGSNAVSTFKGQVQASTLSVTDGMSIRGTNNEVAQAGSITLAAGVSPAANAPTVVNDYQLMPGWKTEGGSAWPSGYEFKTMQRVGTQWVVGARQVSNDSFFARLFNDDGTFAAYYGFGWGGQQIQRCAYVNSGLPVYAFRNTDRRIIAATHSTTGGPIVNSLSWDFASNTQPAGTTEVGTVSYSSGSVLVTATSGVPDSSLEQSAGVDMRGRRLTVKVVPSGTFSAAGQVIEVRARNSTAGEYILARFEGPTGLGTIKLQTYNGSVGSTKTATATVPSGYNYLRLTESNGDARLQVSIDGNAWSTVATIADHGLTDADLSAMAVGLICRAGDAGQTTTARFDDVTIGAGFVDYGDTIPWADTANPPALGSDGTYILAAETTSDNRMKIYEIDPRSPGRIVTTYTSDVSSHFANSDPVVTVAKGSFDFGSTRFVVSTGTGANPWAAVFTVSGTALTYQREESFYVPGQAGCGWDGTVFQTLATDGTRRKHTAIVWSDVTAWEKTWYAATTWYDGDATGGTHETTPSPRAAFTFRKRSRYTVTSGDIPDLGGTDDPDRIRIYLASGAATTLYRQTTTAAGSNSAVLATATFSGTAAPVSNDFPGAIAARIVNAGNSLVVSGDGTITATAATISGALAAGSASITGDLTANRVIVTDRTFAEVLLGSNYDTTTTLTDIPGMTTNVDVDNTADRYLVHVVVDAGVNSGTGTAIVALWVNGAAYGTTEAHFASANTGWRSTISQVYLVTGVAAGSRTFLLRASSTSGSHKLYSPHTKMLITQVA